MIFSKTKKAKVSSGSTDKIINQKVREASRKNKVPKTSQETIVFEKIFSNGIARVKKNFYSMTVEFNDINYALAGEEKQLQIFNRYCSFLNHFDSSISFELSFFNKKVPQKEIEQKISFSKRNDYLQKYREEMEFFLRNQFAMGNSSIEKTKYVTFGINAKDYNEAKIKLKNTAQQVLNNFKKFGVAAKVLSGSERLRLMYEMLHLGEEGTLSLNWKKIIEAGLSVKDIVAPDGIYFDKPNDFLLGEKRCSIKHVQILATELTEAFLSDLFGINKEQVVSIQIKALEQHKAIKAVKRVLTEIDSRKIDEQKKASRAGYDADILPPDLVSYGENAKKLLQRIQAQNERAFMITFLVMQVGKDQDELANNSLEAKQILQTHICELKPLMFQQEQGLNSILPLANNQIEIERMMPTSGLGIMMPFWSQELFQWNKRALYVGINSKTGNYISCDRGRLFNPNGLILGNPGTGKSMQIKTEIVLISLLLNDDIMIIDPEGEYSDLVQALGGQRLNISSTSNTYINPFDISIDYDYSGEDDKDPITMKADFILSLCEQILSNNKEGKLEPIQKSIIDRATFKIYEKFLKEPKQENIPILEDLYNALLSDKENPEEAHYLATALELYVKGSQNMFNHRTNVDINKRLTSFDISGLGNQLKALGMLIIEDQIWQRVTSNRNKQKITHFYCDEAHLLLRSPQTASFSVDIYKRFRKYAGYPTFATQNVKDFLKTAEIETIFDNTDYVVMLGQDESNARILANAFKISEEQLSFVLTTEPGSGLLKYGNTIIPFSNQFPEKTELYKLMTTKPNEKKKIAVS